MKKAIIALSGGIDSAVAMAIAKAEGYQLYALTVNYGQKNLYKELENSWKLAQHFSVVEHKVISMEWLGLLGSSLITDTSIDNKTDDNLIYVPYRNTCIIAACLAWAEISGADVIYTGSEAGPWICPDNSPEYYRHFNELVKVAAKTNPNVLIKAPLNQSDKIGNIQKGLELKVPFEYTWTCVTRSDLACGHCQPCRDRLKAFQAIGVKDPIAYASKEKS